MPFRYGIVRLRRLGVLLFDGTLTAADVDQAERALFADDRWRPGFDVLWDGRGARSIDIGHEQVGPLLGALRAAEAAGRPRRHGWVTPDEPHEWMAVLLAHRLRGEGRARRGFPDAYAARRWLAGRASGGRVGRAA